MPAHEEPLTLDDLTEIYRREKKSGTIVSIRPDFYRAVKGYIDQLKKSIAREFSIEGYSAKAKLASTHLTRAQEFAKEIFNFRFKKIQAMALRVAIGGKANLKNLTQEEREFYDASLEILKDWYAFLDGESTICIESYTEPSSPSPKDIAVQNTNIAPDHAVEEKHIETPPHDELVSEEEIDEEIPFEEDLSEEPSDSHPPEIIEPAEVAEAKTIDAQISGIKILVRIVENIPEIAGIDRNYRLKKEDVVTLPAPIAKILIAQKAAFPINTMFIE